MDWGSLTLFDEYLEMGKFTKIKFCKLFFSKLILFLLK